MLAAAVVATDIKICREQVGCSIISSGFLGSTELVRISRIVPPPLPMLPAASVIRWEPKRLCLRSRYRRVVLGLECIPNDSNGRVLSSCQAKEISESFFFDYNDENRELLDRIRYLRSLSEAIATIAPRRSTILTPPSRQGPSR